MFCDVMLSVMPRETHVVYPDVLVCLASFCDGEERSVNIVTDKKTHYLLVSIISCTGKSFGVEGVQKNRNLLLKR